MIFSEIYGSYYKAMTEILKIAVSSGGSAALKDIRPVIDTYGHLFDEVQKSIANDLDGMRRR